MKYKYPEWATEKQKEGMDIFLGIATEYGDFNITFRQDDHDYDEDAHAFFADIAWSHNTAKGERKHEMLIAWDYEPTWNRYNERVHHWQFLFGGGDATREVSSEVFFLDMFWYLDEKANLVA